MTKKRDPYDISTWGPECARGIRHANQGTTVAGKAASLKISTGRKARGLASADLERHAPAQETPNP